MKSIIKKIEKLLALARSSNPNEAELASNKAQRLMIEHNIQMQQLGKEEEIIMDDSSTYRSLTQAEKLIGYLLTTYFNVQVVYYREWDSRYTEIYGTPSNIEIAKYMRAYLHRAFENCWKDFAKQEKGSRPRKNAYQYGLMIGLARQLEATKRECEEEGLVIIRDPRLEEATSHVKRKSKMDKRSSYEVDKGIEDGQSIALTKGVTTETTHTNLMIEEGKS